MAFIGRLPQVGDVHRVWDVEHRVYSFTLVAAVLFISLCTYICARRVMQSAEVVVLCRYTGPCLRRG